MVLGLILALVPARKCPFEAGIAPLLSLQGNENGDPLFYCFLPVMATRKMHLKEKKIWLVEVVFILYEWRKMPHLETQYKWSMF